MSPRHQFAAVPPEHQDRLQVDWFSDRPTRPIHSSDTYCIEHHSSGWSPGDNGQEGGGELEAAEELNIDAVSIDEVEEQEVKLRGSIVMNDQDQDASRGALEADSTPVVRSQGLSSEDDSVWKVTYKLEPIIARRCLYRSPTDRSSELRLERFKVRIVELEEAVATNNVKDGEDNKIKGVKK